MDIKLIASLESAILFLIVSSPFVYMLTQRLFRNIVTISVNGCPTRSGLVLHSLVFGIIVYLLMHISVKSK